MARLSRPGREAWRAAAKSSPPPYLVRAPHKSSLTVLTAACHDLMGRPEPARSDLLREARACAFLTLAKTHREIRVVYDILYASVNGHADPSQTETVVADLRAEDPWLFTDPVAWALYAHSGRLDDLKRDILAHVMYDGQWAPDELQCKHEIERLLHASILCSKGTFGYLSPHPTAYRAAREGVLEIAGRKYHFEAGRDVVFEPWLARVHYPSLPGPVWIGRLRSVTNMCLCCDAFPRAGTLCERGLAILRQTIPNGPIQASARH